MFRISIITPEIANEEGWRHAGGLLVAGDARLPFLVDLTYWRAVDYERQWRAGLRRIVEGAMSTALVTAYRGPRGDSHVIWALWRDEAHVYGQKQAVLPGDLPTPFDPADPYAHVGSRTPSSAHGLPIPEWRMELGQFLTSALGIRGA